MSSPGPLGFDSQDTTLTVDPLQTPSLPAKFGDEPDHRYQVNHDLLYEREFERGAFVSAHLQRLQNGYFSNSNLHTKHALHVTFVAVTFTFHPITSAGSNDHRFESTVIEIAAKSRGLPLKILKFAPHLAFGRISSSNLKWNFQLGATVGVTNSQAKACITPGIEYERDTVVGTMMKIQGSTRSSQKPVKDPGAGDPAVVRLPDTRVVWTLEENTQQKAGIPREFTFVFLMERPIPKGSTPRGDAKADVPLEKMVVQSSASSVCSPGLKDQSRDHSLDLQLHDSRQQGQSTRSFIGSIRSEALKLSQKLQLRDEVAYIKPIEKRVKSDAQQLDEEYAQFFGDVQFSITVKPDIAGMNIPKHPFEHQAQLSTVRGEVGQKFSNRAEEMLGIEGLQAGGGMYNFANLPINFEDLIELPGTTVSTVEPAVPQGKQ